jgi:hypothetical protein
MRGAGVVTLQIVVATVGLALISGLIGFLIVHFAGWGDAVTGFGWGMVIGGGLVGFAVAGSGSPSESLVRGRSGAFGTYWGESAPLPQSPFQFLIAGVLTFAGGVLLLISSYR